MQDHPWWCAMLGYAWGMVVDWFGCKGQNLITFQLFLGWIAVKGKIELSGLMSFTQVSWRCGVCRSSYQPLIMMVMDSKYLQNHNFGYLGIFKESTVLQKGIRWFRIIFLVPNVPIQYIESCNQPQLAMGTFGMSYSTPCPTSRLDMMSQVVDCVFQANK